MLKIALSPSQIIHDPQVRNFLVESQNANTNAPELLFTYFRSVIHWLVSHALYESKASTLDAENRITASSYGMAPDIWQPLDQITASRADILWGNVRSDIVNAAERLWRDIFLEYSTIEDLHRAFNASPDQTTNRKQAQVKALPNPIMPDPSSQTRPSPTANRLRLTTLARWSRRFLLLALEVDIYKLRAARNFAPFQYQKFHPAGLKLQIEKLIAKYNRLSQRWDSEDLQPMLGLRVFQQDLGDSERMKTLASLFGPDKTFEGEEGWLRYAEEAKETLILQCFDMRLKLYRSHWRSWPSYLWNNSLKLTTVYGTSPGRFACVSLGVIGLFAGLFLFNDFANNGIFVSNRTCFDTNVHGFTVDGVVRYLYLAITNLTSLGSNSSQAQYCGGTGASILLMFATLTGYFLLATLAALMMQKLIDSER